MNVRTYVCTFTRTNTIALYVLDRDKERVILQNDQLKVIYTEKSNYLLSAFSQKLLIVKTRLKAFQGDINNLLSKTNVLQRLKLI